MCMPAEDGLEDVLYFEDSDGGDDLLADRVDEEEAEERAHRGEDEHADDTDDGEDESEHDGQRHTDEHPENGEDGGEDVRVDALDDLTARESIRSDVASFTQSVWRHSLIIPA